MNDDIVKRYQLLHLQESRNNKIQFYSYLYSNFQKLNMKRFFVYKSDNAFLKKIFFRKIEFLDVINSNITRRLNNINKKNNISQESTIPEKYAPSFDNIND